MIRARTEPKLKNKVERIFEVLGLTASEAINLFTTALNWKTVFRLI